jgi:hypothetical protein
MNEEGSVSRRATLKNLGAMGAAAVLGGSSAAVPLQAEAGTGASGQGKGAGNVVDVAVARFAKGHS